jgi:hypothetical protein
MAHKLVRSLHAPWCLLAGSQDTHSQQQCLAKGWFVLVVYGLLQEMVLGG